MQTIFIQHNSKLRTVLSERHCVCEGWAVLTRQRNNETVEHHETIALFMLFDKWLSNVRHVNPDV